MSADLLRLALAAALVAAYTVLCAGIFRRERRRRSSEAAAATRLTQSAAGSDAVLVLFASQTGQSERIAWQTADSLHQRGASVRVLALDALDLAALLGAPRALFIASTYGEGDAPDGASLFFDRVMQLRHDLRSLRYAVLALGDRSYQNFCGFGRRLDTWLHDCGATREFARVEVDGGDPAALANWRDRLGLPVDPAQDASPSDADAGAVAWQLVARRQLNPGSVGGPIFELGFRSLSDGAPAWQSGDLARLELADDPGRPRDYSIASIASDGELQLLVRQERHPDGTLGAASGLLTSTLPIGASIALCIRPHDNFRLAGNAARPLLLIGNGTGLAGLRSHLRERAAAGQHANWLVFGERHAAHDFLLRDELQAWQRSGVLERLDMVFSRDQPERLYVQHRLLQAAAELQAWLDRGAAVYVCGSLQGMASGVDAALQQIAGEPRLRELIASGRYRRDVY